MESIKFTKCHQVSIFIVTLEVAIAVVSLVPLSIVFSFFGLGLYWHQGDEPFFPEETKPLIHASGITFISIYILQLFQLLMGILLLKSLTMMKINFLGTIKTSWAWITASVITVAALGALIYQIEVKYGNNRMLLGSLLAFLLLKILSVGLVLRFTVGACVVARRKP